MKNLISTSCLWQVHLARVKKIYVSALNVVALVLVLAVSNPVFAIPQRERDHRPKFSDTKVEDDAIGGIWYNLTHGLTLAQVMSLPEPIRSFILAMWAKAGYFR